MDVFVKTFVCLMSIDLGLFCFLQIASAILQHTRSFLSSSSLKRALNWHCPTSLQASLSQPLFEKTKDQSICLFSPALPSSHKSHLSVRTLPFIETMFTSKSHTMHVIAIQISAIENQSTLWFLYDANRGRDAFYASICSRKRLRQDLLWNLWEQKAAMPGKCLHTAVPQFSDLFFYYLLFHWHMLSRSWGRNSVYERKRWMTDKLSFTFSEWAVPVKSKPIMSCFWIHLKFYIYFQ